MSSLWTNLLHLHGYIIDYKPLNRWVDKPQTPPSQTEGVTKPNPASKATRVAWYARLCLGIGDGALHWQ
jgi:hypothetical protein